MFDAAARDRFQLTPYKLDDYSHVIDEEIDNLSESDEYCITKKDVVDLSSFRPQPELHPKIWPHNKLNSKVRLRLLDIADDFFDTLAVNWVKPKDIILTGSLANYNWSKFSDFDLHIVLDFKDVDERVEFVKDYFDSKKKIWNEQHENLKIYGFPVEVYVQDSNEQHTASGVYSLEKNKWLVVPEKSRIKAIQLNKFFIKEKVFKLMRQIDALEVALDKTDDTENVEQIGLKAKILFDKIKGIRKEALSKGGEMSTGNIIFKAIRRTGYIGKLIDIKAKTYDKIYSIK